MAALAAAIRTQVQAIDPNESVFQVIKMDERMSNSLAERRFQTLLLGVFAGIALVIATVGIYGVVSYAVSRRTHEIGVRMALGAQTGDVLRMVIWQGMSLTLIGVTLGLAAAFALTRVLKNLLFEVSATDPETFALIALLLIGVALIASYIPARRATKVLIRYRPFDTNEARLHLCKIKKVAAGKFTTLFHHLHQHPRLTRIIPSVFE